MSDALVEVIVPAPVVLSIEPAQAPALELLLEPPQPVEILIAEAITVEMREPLSLARELVVLEGVQPVPVAGAGITMILDEVPSGLINNSNTIFTTQYPFQPDGLLVYLNGLRQRSPADYFETSNQMFQLVSAPFIGDTLTVDYLRLI